MTKTPFPHAAVRRLLAAIVATLVLTLGARAAEETRRNFDVPAGDAIATLKQAAQQGGVQIMFPAVTVQDVKTNAVKGDLTTRGALERMLDGTGLVVVQDEKTGAFAVRRDAGPNAPRVAQMAATTPRDPSKVEDGKLVLEKVEVTGSRIRGLLGEADFSPVTSFSRQDIERVGMTSIGELSRLIPQAYSSGSYDGVGYGGQNGGLALTAGSDGSLTQAASTSRATINLRGLGTGSTLVLVDGRRLPTTGVIRGADANDLSGIPVSSIERIDVLTDGASAIYGSDAVGGVINIILRKHYTGTEISLSYENTFNSDTAVRTATLTHSISREKLSLVLSATWQDRHAFAAVDRRFSATNDWTTLGGSSELAGVSNGGFSTAAGAVYLYSGTLPGLGSQYAIIANGTTPANVSLASFLPATNDTLHGDTAPYSNLISPQTTRSASFRLNYRLTPKIELFADGRYGDTTTAIEGYPVNYRGALSVPADYPGNPFGVAVYLNKVFWELPPLQGQKTALTANAAASAGVRAQLPHDWQLEASMDLSRAVLRDQDAFDPVLVTDAYNAAIAARSLVLFYDSRAVQPNDPALLYSLLRRGNRRDKELGLIWSASANGPIWDLPAGPVRLAVGGEQDSTWSITRQSVPDLPTINQSTLGNFLDTVRSGYAETRVPLLAPKQRIPLVNRLDLSAAIRYDENQHFGGHFSPSLGLQWRPVSWLLLRGTRNNAFLAPSLQATSRPVTSYTTNFPPVAANFDPLRNEIYSGPITTTLGGYPELKAQTSVSTNAGIVLQAPFKFLQGFTFSVDFLDIDYTNRISGVSTAASTLLQFFPERVMRGPNRPGDAPGEPGPVIGFDSRPVNIAKLRIRSTDYQVNYHRHTAYGDFDVRGAATVYQEYQTKALPTSVPVDSLYQFPTRLTWQTYWNKGPYGAGVNGFYQEPRYRNLAHTFTPEQLTPYLYGSAIQWDLQLAYDFGWRADHGEEPSVHHRFAGILDHTKLSATVFNVLNHEPPHVDGQGGFAVIDPRMARYVLTLTKSF